MSADLMKTPTSVWLAMVEAERKHGGPLTMTTSDIAKAMDYTLTTGTISRRLWGSFYQGIVKIVPGRPNGYRSWQLTADGRLPFGLPNTHEIRGER